MLLGALGFQFIGGLAPCELCLWQRYPHAAAAGIGILALAIPGAVLPYLGAVAALATAAIGVFHTGVERSWWEGLSTCSSGPAAGLSPDQLMEQIMTAPLVRCDAVAWELFSLSMASWNAIASVGLALLWIAAANHARKQG